MLLDSSSSYFVQQNYQKIPASTMDTQQDSVFKTILLHSLFILASPITTFFVSKIFFFDGLFGASSITSNVWSAVLAVIMLHIALGLYIYRAYNEADKVKPEEKID